MAGKQQPGNGLWADWILGESGYKTQMDSNLRFLSAAVQLVLDQSTGTLPASPTNGMLVATTGSPSIQARIDGAWVVVATAKKGWLGFDKARDSKVEFDGTEWVLLSTGGGGGGIPEAPSDGKVYGRKDESWAEIIGDGGGIPEAPVDGKHYIRKDAQWFELEAGTNVTFDESTAGVIKIEASGAVPVLEPVKAVSDAAYTPVLADAGKYLTFTSPSPVTVTVPANSDVAFPIGTDIAIEQSDIGQVSVVAATGVTINTAYGFNLKTGGQYAVASLKKTGTDTWTAFGNLEVQE